LARSDEAAVADRSPVIRRSPGSSGDGGGEEGVRVAGLELDHALEVGQVVLEPVALDGGDDAVGHQLRRLQGTAVERRVVVGLVPDLGIDGAREDEPHLDAGVPQVQGQGLAPAAQRELAGRIGRLGGDAQAAAQARHVDDDAGVALEHPRQEGQRHVDGGEEVHPHHGLDLARGERGDRPALGDGGVVHDHVQPIHRVPGLEGHRHGPVEVAEVGHPHP
jgi:hypothetical protein